MRPIVATCRGHHVLLAAMQAAGCALCVTAAAHAQSTLEIAPGATIRYGAPWRESPVKYVKAHELVRPSAAQDRTGTSGKSQAGEGYSARMMILPEELASHAAAVQRLEDLAASRPVRSQVSAIGGWPAIQQEFTEPLKRPEAGEERATAEPEELARRATVAIAFDRTVLEFEAWIALDAPAQVLAEAEQIARSCSFSSQSRPDDLRLQLDKLTRDTEQKVRPPSGGPGTTAATAPGSPSAAAKGPRRSATVSLPALVASPGRGEIEVAADSGAGTIVVATNLALAHSTDRGNTFTAANPDTTGTIGSPNDPTLTRSATRFYLGSIAAALTGCVNAVSTSSIVSGAASFTLSGFSAVCAPIGVCFPDQEHLAADAFNTQPADQVYAVWRQFNMLAPFTSCARPTKGFPVASISCSQDNGVNWTPPLPLPGAGDNPRVAVGADGTVYVISLSGNKVQLNRLTSCVSGLTPAPAITVVDLGKSFACPVPGIDRCGDLLASPTVAADPGDPAHLFVSFAESDGIAGERIVTLESHDLGNTFPKRWTLSSGASARRFMPWSCSTLGTAVVGWYDRGAATSKLNDLTDYVAGSPALARPISLSGNSDQQCGMRWPCAFRASEDWTSCSVQPQNSGRCLNAMGRGSGAPCDLTAKTNPCSTPGETCLAVGTGCPKYGDYNGVTCEDGRLIAAWASATPPPTLTPNSPTPPGNTISIYSTQVDLRKLGSSFDRAEITVTTGNDNAGSGVEISAQLSSQRLPICLKPSTDSLSAGACVNGPGARDQNGQDTWDNWSVSRQVFALDNPQDTADFFTTINITLRQKSSCNPGCDNWDIQGLKVRVFDSSDIDPETHAVTLADISHPRNPKDQDNCVARLKAPPNATKVEFGLDPTGKHVNAVKHHYGDGTGSEVGQSTTCKNNGDGG